MPWIELHATTTAPLANELSDQLASLGAVAITFRDAGDNPIFEPTPDTPRLWHETIVTGLFEIDHPIESVIEFLKTQTELGIVKHYDIQHLEDEDWERRCLDSFKPISFGKRLWICPSWHVPPQPDAVNVVLDPGLAFGTGTHPTTSLCLEWLDKNIHHENFIIDYGCGSGILAIAALKLGAQKALAIDNDPQALESTRANSERNSIPPAQIITQLPNVSIDESADILLANILAQPLLDLASHFATLIKTGGKIVLSGILETQVPEIIEHYETWFTMHPPAYKDNWACLSGIRQSNGRKKD